MPRRRRGRAVMLGGTGEKVSSNSLRGEPTRLDRAGSRSIRKTPRIIKRQSLRIVRLVQHLWTWRAC